MTVGRQVRTAFTFLTRIPVPPRRTVGPPGPEQTGVSDEQHAAQLRGALGWFPLVGAVVGALAGGTWWLASLALPPSVAAVLAVAVAVAATGAFHEDGLADTADGLWGGWSRERRLEIMRDSRVGTYGALALVLAVLLLVSTLASLPVPIGARALVVAHLSSRYVVLPLLATLPAARQDGHGAALAAPPGAAAWVAATVTLLVVGGLAAGWWTTIVLAAALASATAVGRLALRLVGGVTGDVLGAANHVALLAGMLAVALLVSLGAPDPGAWGW